MSDRDPQSGAAPGAPADRPAAADRADDPTTGKRARDRGQAFTLEGFVASIVVLTAVLFALQSVVITPTTSGAVDQSVQSQLRTEARDILAISARNGTAATSFMDNEHPTISKNLTGLTLYWNGSWAGSEDSWAFSKRKGGTSEIGYGAGQPGIGPSGIANSGREEWFAIGDMLNDTFTQRGRVYNLVAEYRLRDDPSTSKDESREFGTSRIVYRGTPSDSAVETTFTVTLYDNMTLTGPGYYDCDYYASGSCPGTQVSHCAAIPIETIRGRPANPGDSEGQEDDGTANEYFSDDPADDEPDEQTNNTWNAKSDPPAGAGGTSDDLTTAPECWYPIPDAFNGGAPAGDYYQIDDPELYNVVEIRLVVW